MGFFGRLFGTDPDARIAKARKLIAVQDWAEARWALDELDHPDADALMIQVRAGLAEINLAEARARMNAGDDGGARAHLEMAREFGADPEQVRAVRRAWREERAAAKLAAQTAAIVPAEPEGDDPLWSLPPDDPRLQFAMSVERYPQELRARLIALGPGYGAAVGLLDEGRASEAKEALAPYVHKDAVARFERARASIALNQQAAAASDLAYFGDAVGHLRIGNQHTAHMLGRLMMQLGRIEEARRFAQAETERAQTEADRLPLEALQAAALEAQGDLAGAETMLESLLARAPRAQDLYRSMARVRLRQANRLGAMQALEGGLAKTCSSPGKCGNQPYDVSAARLLARLYLEDRIEPARTKELLGELQKHARSSEWTDRYIRALLARNDGSPEGGELAARLIAELPSGDPRVSVVQQAFPPPSRAALPG